ncbi:hypothetical protein TTRE_0000331501 [Trichuris trichiura]|uniref:Thrombospondin-like N-terminal domain-containing protein n=1 Tax=Trichuris trichiura TaxID=36087 RepID=A0A077Z5E0_TRITR|nr:hypothetical protein TTRE_0000331501 [Trichuris trichiura]
MANDEVEIDLLKAVKAPLDPNIYQAKGMQGLPSFGFQPGANVVVPYRFHMPRRFFRDFAILITVREDDEKGGYLFAVVNPFDTIVELGVLLEPSGDRKTNVSLVYSDHKRDAESRTIASFNLPTITNKWTQLALKVEGAEVTMYMNCQRFEMLTVHRRPKQLNFDEASKLYIAQAGPILNKPFVAVLVRIDKVVLGGDRPLAAAPYNIHTFSFSIPLLLASLFFDLAKGV